MTGKSYLFVMWDGGGTVPPELGIARRLIRRGHRVTVLGEGTLEEEVLEAGCRFVEYRRGVSRASRSPEHDPIRDFEGATPFHRIRRARDELICGRAVDFSRDVREVASEGRFDCVVVDAFLLGAMPGARATGLPTAVVNPGPDMRPQPGRPPAGMGLKPSSGFLPGIRDRILKTVFRSIFSGGSEPVNRARVEAGLPPLSHPFEQWDEVDRYLMLTSEHFDFGADPLPHNLVYVGPQLDDPAWVEAWIPPEGHDPLVLVTLGSTFQDQADTYSAIFESLRGMPVQALATLGKVFDPEDFEPPGNVELVSSAPHGRVLPHASAAVVHGGHGTVMKCLAAGRPMVLVPLGRDQFDNGARVEVAGAGIMVRKPNDRKIRRALEAVVGDPGYREAAEALGEKLRAEVAEDRAVTELEALVAGVDEMESSARHR